MGDGLLTTEKAAKRLGVTSARIRAMIGAGRLPAQKFGHVHMIKEDDLKLVESRKPGRPPKLKTNGTKGKVTVQPGKKGKR